MRRNPPFWRRAAPSTGRIPTIPGRSGNATTGVTGRSSAGSARPGSPRSSRGSHPTASTPPSTTPTPGSGPRLTAIRSPMRPGSGCRHSVTTDTVGVATSVFGAPLSPSASGLGPTGRSGSRPPKTSRGPGPDHRTREDHDVRVAWPGRDRGHARAVPIGSPARPRAATAAQHQVGERNLRFLTTSS